MKVTPKNNYILILPLESERKTKSGIMRPDYDENISLTAKVISLCEKRLDRDYKEIDHVCKEGDIIVHKNFGLSSIEFEGEIHYLIREDDVLAVLKIE